MSIITTLLIVFYGMNLIICLIFGFVILSEIDEYEANEEYDLWEEERKSAKMFFRCAFIPTRWITIVYRAYKKSIKKLK